MNYLDYELAHELLFRWSVCSGGLAVKGILIFFMLFLSPALVVGDEVYQWVDEQGVVHFTDDVSMVPEDSQIESVSRHMPGGESKGAAGFDEAAFEEDEGILIEDDLKEKDEEWWRNRADKWRERLQAGYDDYEKVRLQYNETATEFNASKDPEEQKELKAELDKMQAEMERYKADIEKARHMTEDVLPAQAQQAGKPVEWVR